jgi:hypothetical protein
MSADFLLSAPVRQILKHNKKSLTSMHYEDIELNFDASCQQIIGLES